MSSPRTFRFAAQMIVLAGLAAMSPLGAAMPRAPVQAETPCPPGGLPPAAEKAGRAMWLWDSRPLLDSADARQRLFELCRCEGIATIWMQIAVRRDHSGAALLRADAWPSLLREAHAAGLRVEALDGSPTHALRRFHEVALATIDAMLAYNKGVEPVARFDGFHYDIEPYSLYRWRFPEHRERIVSEYLEVVLEAHRRVRTQPGLRFGVAVPFWWHREDEVTGEPFSMVTIDGVRKPATFHLIDRLDYVAIMSYRDRAEGPNGLIGITRDILEYADTVGQDKVFLGVETAGGSARVWFVTGLIREAALARMRAHGEDPDTLDPIDDYARTIFDDGTRLHVGVRIPAAESPETPGVIAAMRTIAEKYGAPMDERRAATTRTGESHAIAVLKKDTEWRDVAAHPIPAASAPAWSGFLGTSVTPQTITFENQPVSEMRNQLATAQSSFVKHRSFAGLAIHDHVHFVKLLGR